MASKTRVPAILLIFLLVVAIAAAVLGFIGLQKEKQINAALTEEKQELEIKKKAAEKEINGRIASLDEKLSDEKKAKEEALSEAVKLRNETAALKNSKAKLETDLKVSTETLNSIKEKLAAIEAYEQKNDKEQKAQESKPQDVQLEKIVITPEVKPAQAPLGGQAPETKSQLETGLKAGSETLSSIKDKPVAPAAVSEGKPAQKAGSLPPAGKTQAAPLEGKVLVVNNEYDFVVVNIGQKENVAVGDTFDIFHKEKKIGQMKVEEVRDTMSVAMPVTPNLIKQIKEDDRVVRK
jgi:hypothetical protein